MLKDKEQHGPCPLCGKPVKLRRGRFGKFWSCTDYPNCKGVLNADNSDISAGSDDDRKEMMNRVIMALEFVDSMGTFGEAFNWLKIAEQMVVITREQRNDK